MRMRIVYARAPEWAEMAARIDELIGGIGFRALKTSARTSAGFIRDGARETFVKRVTGGPWVKGIFERVRGSRAARAVRGAAILEAAGFAHPRPLAAVEARAAGAVYASYILSEPLHEARILSDFALRDGRNFRRRQRISARVASEIRRLHDRGLYTLDLQETNLMIAADSAEMTVYFVDLEDFRRARRVTMRRRLLNLVHLDRSIGRFVSRTQRLRFFYNYLGGKLQHDEARRLVGRLMKVREREQRQSGYLTPASGAANRVGAVDCSCAAAGAELSPPRRMAK